MTPRESVAQVQIEIQQKEIERMRNLILRASGYIQTIALVKSPAFSQESVSNARKLFGDMHDYHLEISQQSARADKQPLKGK